MTNDISIVVRTFSTSQWAEISQEILAPRRATLATFIMLGLSQCKTERSDGFSIALDQLEADYIDAAIVRLKEKRAWPT